MSTGPPCIPPGELQGRDQCFFGESISEDPTPRFHTSLCLSPSNSVSLSCVAARTSVGGPTLCSQNEMRGEGHKLVCNRPEGAWWQSTRGHLLLSGDEWGSDDGTMETPAVVSRPARGLSKLEHKYLLVIYVTTNACHFPVIRNRNKMIKNAAS